MQKIRMIFLISLGICLSACKSLPEAPIVQRCVIDLESMKEICYNYRIDVIGGYTDPDSEVIRSISDRSICFPVDHWVDVAVWRDEVIEWAEDNKK